MVLPRPAVGTCPPADQGEFVAQKLPFLLPTIHLDCCFEGQRQVWRSRDGIEVVKEFKALELSFISSCREWICMCFRTPNHDHSEQSKKLRLVVCISVVLSTGAEGISNSARPQAERSPHAILRHSQRSSLPTRVNWWDPCRRMWTLMSVLASKEPRLGQNGGLGGTVCRFSLP